MAVVWVAGEWWVVAMAMAMAMAAMVIKWAFAGSAASELCSSEDDGCALECGIG